MPKDLIQYSDEELMNIAGISTQEPPVQPQRDLSPYSDEELLQVINKPTQSQTLAENALPGLKRTQELKSKRRDAWEVFIEELRKPLPENETSGIKKYIFTPKKAIKGVVTAAKAINVPLQKAEASISNVLEGIQTREKPKEIGSGVLGGLTGKEIGQFGDVIRNTGVGGNFWNEVMASTSEFFARIKLSNTLSKGLVMKGIKKGQEFIKSKLPKIMNKDYTLNRARMASQGLNDLNKGLSQEYEEVFNKIGRKMVDITKAQEVVDDLPQNVITKITKDNLMSRYKDGSLHPVINNLKRMRDILRKSVPDNVWNGKLVANPEQHFVKEAYYKIGDLMAEGNPELISLNQRYREFRQMRDTLGHVFYDQEGNVKAEGLEKLFSSQGARHVQKFFEKYIEMYPKAAQIMKDIIKFNTREGAKRLLGRGALVLGGYEAGRRLIVNPLLEKFQGE